MNSFKQPGIFLVFLTLGLILGVFLVKLFLFQPVSQLTQPTSKITSNFDLNLPPSQSLTGQVVTFSGQVKWQSREATEPAQIKSLIKISQGEKLVTEGGFVEVKFPGVWQLDIGPKSDIDFAQTLPVDLVVNQNSGTVKYIKLGQNVLSIRAFHLLINQNSGTITVTVNQDQKTVSIQAAGTATLAFENSNNISQKLDLLSGKTLRFADATRTVVIR